MISYAILARIFHTVSTDAAQSGMSDALRLFGRLDILSNGEWNNVEYVLESEANGVIAENYVVVDRNPGSNGSDSDYELVGFSGKGKSYNEETGLPDHETVPIYVSAQLCGGK